MSVKQLLTEVQLTTDQPLVNYQSTLGAENENIISSLTMSKLYLKEKFS